MKNVVIKAKGSAIKHGTYEFSDAELQEKGVELSGALRRKDEIESELKEIKSEYKNKVDKVNSIIKILSNDLSNRERTGDMQCLVYLEEREGQWFKVFESKDYGHEVAAEPFDYARDQHLFDFTEKRDTENGVKRISFEGKEVMTVPLAAHERQLSLEDNESEATLAKYQEMYDAGQEDDEVPFDDHEELNPEEAEEEN